MALSDVLKKGTTAPSPGDLIEGGIGIDTVNKKMYFKANDGTIVDAASTADTSLSAVKITSADILTDYVVAGLLPVTDVSLTSEIGSGSAYVDGIRYQFDVGTSKTYTASKDTYVDLNSIGVFTYTEVANGAGAPSLVATSIRLAMVETDVDNITAVTDLRILDIVLAGRDVAADGTKLDTIETGATADQSDAEIFAAVLNEDGAGSNLDADLLDGNQGSYYASVSSLNSLVDSKNTFADSQTDYVVSGYLPLTDVSLTSNIGSGIAYVNGIRIVIGDTANTYTASVDTYVDLSSAGTFVFTEVANGAGAPVVTGTNLRLAKVVTDGDNITSVGDLRTLTSTLNTALKSDAGDVVNTPAGNIVAVNVQAAIDELDGQDTSIQGNLDTHIADVTDVHDAGSITNTPAGDLIATDVQAAINELDAEKLNLSGGTLTGDLLLAAISKVTNANTIVDVFYYDTSKDSDGGAWRDRTSHTSWYNETLNTGIRGATRKFPAIALIVAEADKVTIYDATDSSLSMWMVINREGNTVGNNAWFGRTDISVYTVSMLDSLLVIGTAGAAASGLSLVDFTTDELLKYASDTANSGKSSSNIANRGNDAICDGGDLPLLVNLYVNDIAITVLPNAPIDSETGLPIPTIAVATDGGVSVIKDDGNVWDITGQAGIGLYVSFVDNYIATYYNYGDQLALYSIPTADISYTLADRNYQPSTLTIPSLDIKPGVGAGNISNALGGNNSLMVGTTEGLAILKENTTTASEGMVNYITKDYCSGWMHGDIKGAWLADTDTTDLVGTELVTNGTFDTDVTGWTVEATATDNSAAGYINITTGGASNLAASQVISTVIGETYTLSADVVGGHNTAIYVGPSAGGFQEGTTGFAVSGVLTLSFIASTTTLFISIMSIGASSIASADNISVRLAVEDRSVNNNGLQTFGTVTKTAVATGAELVAYSGFSVSNYLQQPYNADLDFGTGDFHVMGWFNNAASGLQYLFSKSDGTADVNRFGIYLSTNTITYFDGVIGNSAINHTIDYGINYFLCFTRVGNEHTVYINSVSDSFSATPTNFTNAGHRFRIGLDPTMGLPAVNCKMALWRIGAGAPSAEQIKEIYESERHLFQDNAACTLNQTTDSSVQALSHDFDTELLHVAGTDSLDTFKGLQRVSSEVGVYTSLASGNGSVHKGN